MLVNRAAAVTLARGPEAGLAAAVDAAPGDHRLLLRAELHGRLGRPELAAELLRQALPATRNEVERRHLRRRLASWTG